MRRGSCLAMLLMLGLWCCSWASNWGSERMNGWGFGCKGLIMGECEVDESIRRILADAENKYISYRALKKDSVPCSKAGVSYYNCGGTGPPNPYSRSCTTISGCARDTG
ncbi:hypothetical protein AMTR_s00013p00262240 [Amborella trichopoda]|uniref:Rapid alkalinization factor 1 n=1 Tax=Amborella trichopoda TaxID=13333 RepID=W1PJD3_AMBTC|nr:hypothetical protein AMTR_s00013p00262240 [Amborella trichopoda]